MATLWKVSAPPKKVTKIHLSSKDGLSDTFRNITDPVIIADKVLALARLMIVSIPRGSRVTVMLDAEPGDNISFNDVEWARLLFTDDIELMSAQSNINGLGIVHAEYTFRKN